MVWASMLVKKPLTRSQWPKGDEEEKIAFSRALAAE